MMEELPSVLIFSTEAGGYSHEMTRSGKTVGEESEKGIRKRNYKSLSGNGKKKEFIRKSGYVGLCMKMTEPASHQIVKKKNFVGSGAGEIPRNQVKRSISREGTAREFPRNQEK